MVAWGDHHPCLFRGTTRFFRPGYRAHLVASGCRRFEGVVKKLEAGAKVADVGCGHDASTVILARGVSKSRFEGFDYGPSITTARQRAADGGVAERVRFEQSNAKSYTGRDYDLITSSTTPARPR
ncbi:MAG: class I SAM-dependent methyltransferase [Rubrivivax sp.]